MRRAQAGFTILEIAVALTVLMAGGAVLWYSLRASDRADGLNRLHRLANQAARSELESLRALPRANIQDTSYEVAAGGQTLTVGREVFDSAKIVASLPEVTLDNQMSPVELRKPLEVRVRVWWKPPAGETPVFPAEGEESGEGRRLLVSLTLKLPEYQWY